MNDGKVITLRPSKPPVTQGPQPLDPREEADWEAKRQKHLLRLHMRALIRAVGAGEARRIVDAAWDETSKEGLDLK